MGLKRLLLATSALASCLFSIPAQAQTYTWGGTGSTTTDGDYSSATNWSNPPAGAPPVSAGQSAIFDATGSTVVVIIGSGISPDSWTFTTSSQNYSVSAEPIHFSGTGIGGYNLINEGGTNTFTNGMTGNGISVTGGQLQLNGGANFTTTSVTGGTLANGGLLTSTITNSATFTNSNHVVGDITNSGTFSNTGTVTGALSQSAGSATNTGTITSTLSLTGGTFTNNTGGQVQGATTNNGGTVNNNATMAGVTNTSGLFKNNNNATITTLTNDGGTFDNDDQGRVTGAATVSSGIVHNAGTFASTLGLTGGSFLNTGSGFVLGATTNNGGTVTNGGEMAGVTNTSGTFNNDFGSITTLNNNGGTFVSASGTTVSGAATISAGSVTNSGTFSSTLSLTGGQFYNFGVVQGATTNNGGVVNNNAGATMADVTNTAGTFNNGSGASITTLNNSDIVHNNGAILGDVTISGGTVFVTNGGTIGGAVSLTNAAGTLDISGVTTGLSVAGLAGVGGSTVNLGAKTLTIAGSTQTFGGTIQGGGNLVIASGVSEALTGINTYTGTTTVNGGVLVVDGSIATSSMTTVNSGLLRGVGSVGNLTVNGGGFAPGEGVVGGVMTVSGSLTMTAASTYIVEVTPATSTSSTVTANANLGGATLGASFAAGSYVAKQYTVLSAGSITGSFNPTVTTLGLPAGFTTSVSYDATLTHAYLNLVLSFAPPSGNLNTNQQNVGNTIINFFNTTGGIPMAFGSLTPSGLTQISGEVGSAPQQTTFNAMTQFLGVMTDPFVAGRGDPVSAGGAPNAFAEESTYSATGKGRSANARDAFAAYTKAPVAPSFEQRWSVWAAGFGGSQQTDGNAALGSNTTTSSLYATAVGADYRVSRDTLLGFALAGGGTNFSVANNLGGGRSDLFQAGAFFRHNAGPAYITGALAYGWQDITTDRTVTVAGVDRLRAEFNANAWSGRLEGGYRFVSQGVGLTPYAAAQATVFDLPAYAEQAIAGSNQFALAYGANSVTDPRSELGLRTDKSFGQDDGIVTLRGRVAWAHDFNSNRSIGATFQTLPGASFVVNGAAMAADSALVTASAEKKWLNGWSAAATFEGEFSDVTRSYAGKGVVRYAW